MTDWIPFVSQLKSVVQLVCLDPEAAWNTQKNFVKKCPLVSHAVGATVGTIGLLCQDDDCKNYGWEAIVEGTKTTSNFIDGIPVVGHAKGGIHHLCGDADGGNKALVSATRTSCVLGAGAGGFFVGGPVGAVGAGVASGITFDGIQTANSQNGQPHGIWALGPDCKSGDYFDIIVGTVGDGLTGYAGGTYCDKMVRADQIQAVENIKMQIDKIQQRRLDANLPPYTPEQLKSVWTEVVDLDTGKTYYGVNEKFRQKARLTTPNSPNPNLFIENNPIPQAELPIEGRLAQSCAETQAMHQLLKDNPTATNTQVNTFSYKNGEFKNLARCDNCLARADAMGHVPTDPIKGGIDLAMMEIPNMPSEFYEHAWTPDTWYSNEHTVHSNAQYANRIKVGGTGHIPRKLDDDEQRKNKRD